MAPKTKKDLKPSPTKAKAVTPDYNKSSPLAKYRLKPIRRASRNGVFLKFKPIVTPNSNILVLKAEYANDPYKSPWEEKLLADETDTEWGEAFGFHNRIYKWHQNGAPVINPRGFAVRLFMIELASPDPIPKETLLEMGQDICDKLKLNDPAKIHMTVNEDCINWGHQLHTFKDILGTEQTKDLITFLFGTPGEGFYENNREELANFFKHGHLTPEEANFVYAPTEAILPSLRFNEPSP